MAILEGLHYMMDKRATNGKVYLIEGVYNRGVFTSYYFTLTIHIYEFRFTTKESIRMPG